jgi:hypothetical protein
MQDITKRVRALRDENIQKAADLEAALKYVSRYISCVCVCVCVHVHVCCMISFWYMCRSF